VTLLLQCRGVTKKIGMRDLFSELTFGVFRGDRLGIVGPNGSGKSTLLKILIGDEVVSSGEVIRIEGLRLSYVAQDSIFPDRPLIELLCEHLQLFGGLSDDEAVLESQIQLSKLGFEDASVSGAHLSGGWKKRFDIALALIVNPDILLLDEPTNHLDLEGVLWLEQFLQRQQCAYLVVSHDRIFLQNTCRKIMEVNKAFPKGFFTVNGSYEQFVEKRIEFLEAQLSSQRSLESKLRKEVEWMKRSPKARTTKSRSRMMGVENLLKEHEELKSRNQNKTALIDFQASERQTKRLLVGKNLSKSFGEKVVFSNVDIVFSPGVRLGIVGENGSGKSTLLNLIAGNLESDTGTLKRVEDLQIVYFDQHREQLPKDLILKDALSPYGDYIVYRGQRIHVNGWCRKFLFSVDDLRLPIGQLSGGECARILIARLMLKPADILLLDEPTNDLDIPTLELLQDCLVEFKGAVGLITHDRYFLDQVSTSILALHEGKVELFADYSQWDVKKHKSKGVVEKSEVVLVKDKKRSLSYKEKKELEGMERSIMDLEKEIKICNEKIQSKEVQSDSQKLLKTCRLLEEKNKELEKLFMRWETLELLKD
jgi:ABC transport system ATP-binding/permease protein